MSKRRWAGAVGNAPVKYTSDSEASDIGKMENRKTTQHSYADPKISIHVSMDPQR